MTGRAARAGLSGDERAAEEFLCGGFGLGPAGDEEHAAGLAASARVDLRLDDGARAAQFVEGLRGLLRRRREAAGGHGESPRGEQRLGLVFVDVHARVRFNSS